MHNMWYMQHTRSTIPTQLHLLCNYIQADMHARVIPKVLISQLCKHMTASIFSIHILLGTYTSILVTKKSKLRLQLAELPCLRSSLPQPWTLSG